MKLKTLQKLQSEANSKEEVFDTCLLPDPRTSRAFSHKYDIADYEEIDLYTGNVIKDNSDFAKLFEAKKRGGLDEDIDIIKSLDKLNKRGGMDALALEIFKARITKQVVDRKKAIMDGKVGNYYHSGHILEQVFNAQKGAYEFLRMVECDDYCYTVYGWNVYFVGIDHDANINYSKNKQLPTVRECLDSRNKLVKAYYQ